MANTLNTTESHLPLPLFLEMKRISDAINAIILLKNTYGEGELTGDGAIAQTIQFAEHVKEQLAHFVKIPLNCKSLAQTVAQLPHGIRFTIAQMKEIELAYLRCVASGGLSHDEYRIAMSRTVEIGVIADKE